jgi:GTP-binding protein
MHDSARAARKLLQQARFAQSVPSPRQLPPDEGIEIAFAGRSNTGKSSAINVLCAQRGLARTSRTPGRTQHLVVFELDAGRRLVDLPGFGYARVARSVREHWERALPAYLEQRRSLTGLVLLMDVRHPLRDQERQLLAWCADVEVPIHLLLNKADKVGRGEGAATLARVTAHLRELGSVGEAQLFSAQTRLGTEGVYARLAQWLDLEEKKKGPGPSS